MQAGVVADMCNIRRAAQRPTILATARHARRARPAVLSISSDFPFSGPSVVRE